MQVILIRILLIAIDSHLDLYGGEGVGGVWNICGYFPSTRKGNLGISGQVLEGLGKGW
jgi:hypothetical protein